MKILIQKQQEIDIDVKDLVELSVKDFGVLVGTVEAITTDYISLRNLVVTEPVDDSTLIFQGSVLFYIEEIIAISIIGGTCNVKPLKIAN
ncbi:hypothetical protein [Robertmurraya massiliosenegalensis]|uniref:hypothetical protein n=1 Tax=Robertmurraya massiliosenegalensis TaxID=1287657 RepID=UPI0002D42371|nr:hypothetical protein [Robertmurraya massiliosenegalensis]